MKKTLLKLLPLCLMFSLLTYGCTQDSAALKDTAKKPAAATAAQAKAPAAQKKAGNVLKGKIVGKSNKAKSISIKVGKGDKAKTMMVKFDDKTKGIEHAKKGHAAIITFEKRGKDLYAVNVKPKLAKLPKGVTEIKVKELKALLDKGEPLFLADARPAKRYAAGHIPGAVSIPVAKLKKEKAAVLPKDKNMPIVFYCGGPT